MTSFYWFAMFLASREPYAAPVVIQRGITAVHVVLDLDATRDEQLIELSIGHHESRWLTRIKDDRGACGPTAIEGPEAWGSSCKMIYADPAEGYRVSLRVLRHARHVCPGTWARVLTVYVSGTCGVAPMKARELCAPVGLCDERYE